jgi:HAD superfamily hydrolase (TIGR01484 family)
MNAKAVFLDIDGTIVTNEGEGPFADDIASIEDARKCGHKVLICTGRGFEHIQPEIRDAPYWDGFVAGGGAHVVIAGKTIYQKVAPLEALAEIASLFFEEGLRCTFQGENYTFGINRSDYTRLENPADFLTKYRDANIAMMTLDLRIGEKIRAACEKYFDIYPQIPHFDAFLKGESKAKGMEQALCALGIPRADTVAIGDSANDLDMVRFAAVGIAVEDGFPELKAAASWVAPPCGKGPVAAAFKRIELI